MSFFVKQRNLCAAGLIFFPLLIAAGCAPKGPTPAAPSSNNAGSANATLISAGKTVFAANRCAGCHAVGGQGGGRAPDLSHEGADPKHTAAWLAAYVKDPKQVNPRSRMAAFGNRINDSDLTALGTYLASLK